MSEIPKLPQTSAVMVPMSGWANRKTIAKVERELHAWSPSDITLVTITFTDGSTWHLSACSCCGGIDTDDVEDAVETQQMVDALIEARAVGKHPEEVLHQLVNREEAE